MQTKLLSKLDSTFFTKAVQTYIFFRQPLQELLPESVQGKMQHGRNITFSLITGYVKKEQFEIAYLQELNELLKELFNEFSAIKTNLPSSFILPESLHELVLAELVPLRFSDEETGEEWQLLYNSAESVCMWNVSKKAQGL